jgi:hypothetical protein
MEIHERNIEDIRRKNLEDNQIFLEKLLMINVNYLLEIFSIVFSFLLRFEMIFSIQLVQFFTKMKAIK